MGEVERPVKNLTTRRKRKFAHACVENLGRRDGACGDRGALHWGRHGRSNERENLGRAIRGSRLKGITHRPGRRFRQPDLDYWPNARKMNFAGPSRFRASKYPDLSIRAWRYARHGPLFLAEPTTNVPLRRATTTTTTMWPRWLHVESLTEPNLSRDFLPCSATISIVAFLACPCQRPGTIVFWPVPPHVNTVLDSTTRAIYLSCSASRHHLDRALLGAMHALPSKHV
jgi:hypothetical protein